MRQQAANRLFAGALILAAIVLIWIATGFRSAASLGSSMLDSSFVPITVLVCIIICSAALVARGFLLPSEADADAPVFDNGMNLVRAVATFLVVLVAYFAWEHFGFTVTSVAMAIAIAAIMATRSIPIYVFLLLFGPLVAYVFSHMLAVQI